MAQILKILILLLVLPACSKISEFKPKSEIVFKTGKQKTADIKFMFEYQPQPK